MRRWRAFFALLAGLLWLGAFYGLPGLHLLGHANDHVHTASGIDWTSDDYDYGLDPGELPSEHRHAADHGDDSILHGLLAALLSPYAWPILAPPRVLRFAPRALAPQSLERIVWARPNARAPPLG